MTSILSTFLTAQTRPLNLFNKIDTDSNGSVSEQEFVSSRPSDISETQAKSLYSAIDKEGTGALTEEQLNKGLEENKPTARIGSETLASLLQVQSSLTSQISELFNSIDGNDDGLVTEQEFVSSRSEGVSEEQASALFNAIDTEGTGSITEDQLAEIFSSSSSASSASAPPVSPPASAPPSGGGTQAAASSEETTYDELDTNKDGVVSAQELLAASVDETGETEETAENTSALDELLGAISAYTSSYSSSSKASSLASALFTTA